MKEKAVIAGFSADEKKLLNGIKRNRGELAKTETKIDALQLSAESLAGLMVQKREEAQTIKSGLYDDSRTLVESLVANEAIPDIRKGALIDAFRSSAAKTDQDLLVEAAETEASLAPLDEALSAGQVVLDVALPWSVDETFRPKIMVVKEPGIHLDIQPGAYLSGTGVNFSIDAEVSKEVRGRQRDWWTNSDRRATEPPIVTSARDSRGTNLDIQAAGSAIISGEQLTDLLDRLEAERLAIARNDNERPYDLPRRFMVVGLNNTESFMEDLAVISDRLGDTYSEDLLRSLHLGLRTAGIALDYSETVSNAVDKWRDEIIRETARELVNSVRVGSIDNYNMRNDPLYIGPSLDQSDYLSLFGTLHSLGVNFIDIQDAIRGMNLSRGLNATTGAGKRAPKLSDYQSFSLNMRRSMAIDMASQFAKYAKMPDIPSRPEIIPEAD